MISTKISRFSEPRYEDIFSAPRNENIDPCKSRILRAIRKGNNEFKYILESVTSGSIHNLFKYGGTVFADSLKELQREGVIKYNSVLEGYYLA